MVTKREKVSIEDLAQLIASTTKGVRPIKPNLRLIQPARATTFDSITRASCLARIRTLRKMYRLEWLVDQATFDRPGLESLEDPELSGLLQDCERARECIVEDIPFDDAGLIRATRLGAID